MFYGWYIVAAITFIGAIIGGTTTMGTTAMVNPIAATMGWSYAQISLAMTLRGIESGVMNPFVGVMADRWPARWLVLIGIIITGIGLLFLSRVNNLPTFYASFIIMGIGGSLSLQVVPMTVIARWFKTNSGKAYGIMAAGLAGGGFLIPIVTLMIDTYGWRSFLVGLAVVVLVIGIPLSFVFRDRPEDYRLLPDGKLKAGLDNSHRLSTQDVSKVTEVSMGIKEAIKTRAFWSIGIAFMLQVAGGSAVLLHIMPYLVSLEIERSTASMIAMFISIVSIPSRFTFGWLSDIFKKSYVAAAAIASTGIGLFLFSNVEANSIWIIVGFVIFYGFGRGAQITVMPPLIREYFGPGNFGTIFGLTSIFITVGVITTPPLAGWVFDTRGVYDPIWLIFCGVSMLAAIIMLTLPRAHRKPKQDGSQLTPSN
jgi:sugar phosphate permease